MPGSGLRLLSIWGGEGSHVLQPLLIVFSCLQPYLFFFFLGIFLLIASFSLLEPDAKPSKIDGKFSVDLAICSLCPSKFSVFELDDVYSCFSFFFFAGVNVKETASLNCCGNLKFVLK